VTGSSDGILRIWDAISGAEILEMRGHKGWILSVNFSSDGHRIISGSLDRTVCVWNATTGDEIIPPLQGHRGRVRSVQFSPDGTLIASGAKDKTIRIWENIRTVYIYLNCTFLSVQSTVQSIMLASQLMDLSRLGTLRSLAVPESPESPSLPETFRFTYVLPIWDAISGAEVSKMQGHKKAVLSVAFSPDGYQIISGSSDKTVRVWHVTTGLQVHGHKMEIVSVFFSPEGRRIISQSRYESLSWDTATGHRLRSTEESDYRLSGSLYRTHDGWIMDSTTDRTLGKLPAVVSNSKCATQGRSLAVGAHSGPTFMLYFPQALTMSPETRVVNGNVRERYGRMPYSTNDSSTDDEMSTD
jgi:WD40 repeat protein